MDKKHKILVVFGSIAVLASAGGTSFALLQNTSQPPTLSSTSSLSAAAESTKQIETTPQSSASSSTSTSTQTQGTSSAATSQSTTPSASAIAAPSNTTTPTTSGSASTTTTTTPAPAPTPAPQPAPTYAYKSGVYVASASYNVPGGHTNSVSVTLTISNDSVTADSNQHTYNARTESASYISAFQSSVGGAVIGKSLATLNPSRIGGASLTTAAFDKALDAIRAQAKA